MHPSLHSNLSHYLGEVFFWNYQPNSLWHVQGILDVNSDCPKVLVISTEDATQSAVIPGGLFHDSIEHGLLRLSERPKQWQLPPLTDLSEFCRTH